MDRRIAQTVAAYDEAAEAYQEAMSQRRPLDAVRKFAGMAGRGSSVLDVACGPVLDVRLLRDAGLRVVAGDRSHESMRVGKLLFPKGSLARWDFRQLPFLDDTFEGIWAHAALQHLPRAQIRATLAELRRVQRSGPIFLSFPEGSADLEPMEDPPAGRVYVTTVSSDELRALLLDAGYGEVEVDTRVDSHGRDLTWLYGYGLLPAGKAQPAGRAG